MSLDLDDAPLSGVLAAALVLLLACAHLVLHPSRGDAERSAQQEVGAVVGLTVGAASIGLVIFLRGGRGARRCVAAVRVACSTFLLIMWLLAIGILTFAYAPFTPGSGNGYFSCWLGFFSAASLTMLEFVAP